jgi:hypothetical protein
MARKRTSRQRRQRNRRPPSSAPAGAVGKSKDEIAREQLEPLAEGERPLAVTIAAIVAALIALSNLVGWIAGIEVGDESFSAGEVLPPVIIMLVAAVGMWYGRYWAVLGFQAILAILIVLVSIALTTASNLLAVVVSVAIIAAAGTLFWFLVKSLARIQMPERRRPEPNR